MPNYIIEASVNGREWKMQTCFNNGDINRWNEPFDIESAKKEAEGFKEVRASGRRPEFSYVRLIVNI